MATPSELFRVDGGGIIAASANHNVLLPGAVPGDIPLGALILVFLAIESGAGQADFTGGIPAGWVKTEHAYNSSNNCNAVLFSKVALGNEGGTTVTFVTVGTHRHSSQSAVISGWYGTLASGLAADSDATGGLGGTNDPPNLAPSFGGEDIRWYVFKARNDLNTSNSIGYPSGYSDGLYSSPGGTTVTKTSAATATRAAAVAAEDPGAFTGTAGVCMTIAVRPADTAQIRGLAYDPIEGTLYMLRQGTNPRLTRVLNAGTVQTTAWGNGVSDITSPPITTPNTGQSLTIVRG